ncbi:hypothetical protein [Rufibacter roseus]|uniref:Uncharacterized protein n=1 Tax=Rufibacter roseus TaxID=1567108 RepID=A0ABW2DG81_9BACT|nr:hypothetical protein [Rufibacter roseus]
MRFGTFLDATSDFFYTVLYPPRLHSKPYKGNGVYLLYSKVVAEFDFHSMELEKMANLPFQKDSRY